MNKTASTLSIFACLLLSSACNKSPSIPQTPASLLMAVKEGDIERVRQLVDNGVPINSTNEYGWSALHLAVDTEIVAYLLEKGADVNARDQLGRTPLYSAAGKRGVAVAKLLIAKHADLNTLGIWGMAPIHYALFYGDEDIAKLLIESGADLDLKDEKLGWTALHYAAYKTSLETVILLLQKNVNVNIKDSTGRTPLHLACNFEGSEQMQLLYLSGFQMDSSYVTFEVVRLLLEKGADPTIKDTQGFTPIDVATKNNHKDLVRLLNNKCFPK